MREEYERIRERHRALADEDEDSTRTRDESWIVRKNGCVLSSFVCACSFFEEEEEDSCTRSEEKKKRATAPRRGIIETARRILRVGAYLGNE